LEEKKVRWLNFLGKTNENRMDGEYEVMRLFDDHLVVKHSQSNLPPHIYSIIFKNLNTDTLD